MPLAIEEIVRGAVAILDGDVLLADKDVASGDHGRIGKRPFLCIESDEESCRWVLLTTKSSPKRMMLDNCWKIPGSPRWMTDVDYLHDARKEFAGPKECFISASKEELTHQPHNRPGITEVGVLAIEAEMARYFRRASSA